MAPLVPLHSTAATAAAATVGTAVAAVAIGRAKSLEQQMHEVCRGSVRWFDAV